MAGAGPGADDERMLLPLGPWGLDSVGTAALRFLSATPATERRAPTWATRRVVVRRRARRTKAVPKI
jgi:hypothetical protein